MHVLVESCTCARSHQVAYVRVYSICIIRVLVCSPVAWSYPFHATSTWSSVKHKTFAKPMDMMVCLNIATPALTNSSSLSLVSVPSTSACSVCLNGQFWSKKVILGLTRSQMLSADLFCMHLHLLIESAFSSSSKPSLLVTSSPDFPWSYWKGADTNQVSSSRSSCEGLRSNQLTIEWNVVEFEFPGKNWTKINWDWCSILNYPNRIGLRPGPVTSPDLARK